MVDCQSSPGNMICRDILNIKNAMRITCTGDACYQVWRGQIQALNRFIRNFDAYITYGPIASVEMGNLANEAARGVCGAKSTGNCEWMKALFYAKSAGIDRLTEIQQGAGLSSVSKCSVNYHCP